MKGCVFCDIVTGLVPAYRVLEDDQSVAFLDHRPLQPGHVLVVPRTHHETFGELPLDLVGPLFVNVQRLAVAVEHGLKADGSFVAVNNRVSQSVPHLHVHVVPRRQGDGLFGKTFQWIRRPYPSAETIVVVQRAIQAALV